MVGLFLFGREDRRPAQPGGDARRHDRDRRGGAAALDARASDVAERRGRSHDPGRRHRLRRPGPRAPVDAVLPVLHSQVPLDHVRARSWPGRSPGSCVADAIWVATPTDAYGLIASSSLVLLGIAAARDPSPRPAARDPAAARRHHLIAEFAVVSVGALAGALMTSLAVRDGAPRRSHPRRGSAPRAGARAARREHLHQRHAAARERPAREHGSAHRAAEPRLVPRAPRRARSRVPHRSEASLALLYVDLDHLKAINDLGGHRAGDRVITEVAGMLRETCRETDLVCRVGGRRDGGDRAGDRPPAGPRARRPAHPRGPRDLGRAAARTDTGVALARALGAPGPGHDEGSPDGAGRRRALCGQGAGPRRLDDVRPAEPIRGDPRTGPLARPRGARRSRLRLPRGLHARARADDHHRPRARDPRGQRRRGAAGRGLPGTPDRPPARGVRRRSRGARRCRASSPRSRSPRARAARSRRCSRPGAGH